jgi:membrane fusion protein (multidrug efflux system)
MMQKEVPLFTIISDEEYWVDANFKETELDRIRPGEQATVTLDMYRRHPFERLKADAPYAKAPKWPRP